MRELGADTGLLVKLLDPGQRLPVHYHPSPEFARHHLGSVHGKNEAWIVLAVDDSDDAVVHLGFKEELRSSEVAALVRRQDSTALLNALHRIPVHPGDTVFVPAGMPHAIGPGVFVLELQEPTDFSVMLEWEAFGLSGDEQLGLPLDTALSCLDISRLPVTDVLRLCTDRPHASGTDTRVRHLFPEAADPYFRARRIRPLGHSVTLPAAFSVLVIRSGEGELHTENGEEAHTLSIGRGTTVLVPYAAGPLTVRGDLDLFQCLPPAI
ncbi:class I mannose-6-phosphate isomerase [Streptomyces olivoreticuli]